MNRQTNVCQNITFPHPTDAGGKNISLRLISTIYNCELFAVKTESFCTASTIPRVTTLIMIVGSIHYRLAMILMTPVNELQPPISDMSAFTLPWYKCTQAGPYWEISHHVLLRKVVIYLVYVNLFSVSKRNDSINVCL